MNTNDIMSQIEMNKATIQRYFDAYNNKNETIFDEIISSNYIDHGQTAYMGSPGRGIDGAKNDLRFSLDKLDDLNYVIDCIASLSGSCRHIMEGNIYTKNNLKQSTSRKNN
jgi:fructose-bisphosphate aldolase class 1